MEFNKKELAKLLQTGIDQLKLSIPSLQQEKLLSYLESLNKWNQSYNLTAVRDPKEMVGKHLLDSLALLPWITTGDRIIDVGTGAGLPGIPLAICMPEKQFTLLDSDGKKTRFLTQVVFQLGLSNIKIEQARVEEYAPEVLWDVILTRAFSDLQEMLQKTRHLCSNNGLFLAMKGQLPEDEIREMGEEFKIQNIIPLTIPGSNAERHLIIIARKNQ
ncbi:MAG: 16S rRNA (guanine(527)-N(7))-methyltransferase RsmG [Proteobacteria bacterium]|nr:16S rRNA (guanine(527)-N(7))-methyltransferase RsmG [Pseudomonadota bacterium]